MTQVPTYEVRHVLHEIRPPDSRRNAPKVLPPGTIVQFVEVQYKRTWWRVVSALPTTFEGELVDGDVLFSLSDQDLWFRTCLVFNVHYHRND